jgi:PhzF family phenazine biosynthesis protein
VTHRFMQVDVFTDTALKGNPVAVVFAADELSDVQMQALAHWTNLSETTFLLRPRDPAADYRVRIFSPKGEFKFAGHPTLGSCHAWLANGGKPKTTGMVVQECGVGLVKVHQTGERGLAFEAPPLKRSAISPEQTGAVLTALGLSADAVLASAELDNGNLWLGFLLRNAEQVLALEPDHQALKSLPKVGVIAPHAPRGPHGPSVFEVRAFAACNGIEEDPVTGSLNASLAQWLISTGHASAPYTALQGAKLGRAGRVHISCPDSTTVLVGGQSVICIQGELTL